MLWGLGLEYSFYLTLTCVAPTGLGTVRKKSRAQKSSYAAVGDWSHMSHSSLVWFCLWYGYVGGMVNTQGGHQLYPGRLQNQGSLESSVPYLLLASCPYTTLSIPSLGWISQCLASQWLGKPWSSSQRYRNCYCLLLQRLWRTEMGWRYFCIFPQVLLIPWSL